MNTNDNSKTNGKRIDSSKRKRTKIIRGIKSQKKKRICAVCALYTFSGGVIYTRIAQTLRYSGIYRRDQYRLYSKIVDKDLPL